MRKLKGLITMSALGIGTLASAQFSSPPPFNFVMFEGQQAQLRGIQQENSMRTTNGDWDTDTPDNTTINNAMFTYKFSPERRRNNLKAFADKVRRENPSSATEMDALFSSVDVIGQIDAAIRPKGLSVQNVADSYTVYWITAWQAAHGIDENPNAQTLAAVRQQAMNAMAGVSNFSAVSDATKQEFAEALLIQAALIEASQEMVAGNSTEEAKMRTAVRQGAKAMGLDLTKMTLTPNGFVPRNGGRSDASDPAADSTQIAANDEGGDNLALYAVAGTGLLAGVFALGKGLSKKG